MYLLDDNVISEVRKGDRCDPKVAAWYASVPLDDLFLSVLVTGEIRKGIESLRARNPRRAMILEVWLGEVTQAFGGRILPVNAEIADVWGRMSADRPRPAVDTLLAATAKVRDMTLVTRNTRDVEGLGARTLNPFEFGADVTPA